MFGRKMNRPQEQQQLKQEVLDADLDIFAFQSSFDQNFHKAIRVGLHCSPSYDVLLRVFSPKSKSLSMLYFYCF